MAFDRVSHHLLIKKLKLMGVNPNLIYLLQNYLTGRKQIVVVDGVCSDPVPVTSGVIQGSILGPLLFNIFVCDLPQCLEFAHCSMYADDSKIFLPVSNITDCFLLQRDLGNLERWCKQWKKELNLEKCQCITFTNKPSPIQFHYHMGEVEIERVSEIMTLA